MIKADVLYIGYRRAATSFLVNYLRNHPQINHDDQQIAEILYHPQFKPELINKPAGKVYVSCDESIAESVCITGRPEVWGRHLYNPGAFNLVRYDLIIDAKEAAKRIKAVYPDAKILMVIRNQVDWFSSLYKSTISQLPPLQRTFYDYWMTPDGIAARLAGHHDKVIAAWTELFHDVLILRCEQLMEPATSEILCQWLNVDHFPFAPSRENESHAGLARLHRQMPFLSAMPLGIKSMLKPLARFIPGKYQPVLSADDKRMICEMYKDSNERTKTMLDQLLTRHE